MKYLALLIFIFSQLVADLQDLNSYQARFIQTIVNAEASSLTYEGTFSAKKPHYALWVYTKPLPKSVYLLDDEITIIEPELEQVIRQKNSSNFSLFKLFNQAQKKGTNLYVTTIGAITYTLKTQGEVLKTLHYRDEFENDVTITFTHCQPNAPLGRRDFTITFPEDYDIINQ